MTRGRKRGLPGHLKPQDGRRAARPSLPYHLGPEERMKYLERQRIAESIRANEAENQVRCLKREVKYYEEAQKVARRNHGRVLEENIALQGANERLIALQAGTIEATDSLVAEKDEEIKELKEEVEQLKKEKLEMRKLLSLARIDPTSGRRASVDGRHD